MAGLVRLEKFPHGVYVLTLIGEGEHRLNPPMFEAIIVALELVRDSEDATALVTTNEGKYYSNGLDIIWVRERMAGKPQEQSRYSFAIMLATLVNLNVPTIAAICGHASAGGFILALAHDHRCMRRDRGYLYMSEMDVRVRMTMSSMTIIRAALSPKAFKDVVLLAKKYIAEEANKAGIVDSVFPNSAETLEGAIQWGVELSKKGLDREFYRTMRLDMRPEVLENLVAGSGDRLVFNHHPVLAKL